MTPPRRLPKISAAALERERVTAWLERRAATPLRYIAAPSGSGKTTSAVLYARAHPAVSYAACPPGADARTITAAIATAAALHPVPESYDELIAALDAGEPREIVLDAIDGATADAVMLLGSIFRDVDERTRFVYLARSEAAVPLARAQAEGLADVGDGGLLAFTPHEIAAYVGALDLEPGQIAPDELHDATHGWAYAVTGACRTAVGTRMRTQAALAAWRRDHRTALDAMIADAVALMPDAIADAFAHRLANGTAADAATLADFKRYGLFVVEHRGRPMLNPLVDRGAPAPAEQPMPAAKLGEIEVFGRFVMTIEGSAVKWRRQRDRHIVAFLALSPNGSATRDALTAAFWPDVDRHLASQSLRTALSTIRGALAACVGAQRVAEYFTAGAVVELRIDAFLVSASQFRTHVDLGERAEARAAFDVAFRHYRTAAALYRGTLLEEEGDIPWLRAARDAYAETFEVLSARIDWLRASTGTLETERTDGDEASVREAARNDRVQPVDGTAEGKQRAERDRGQQQDDHAVFDERGAAVVDEKRTQTSR